MEVVTEKQTSDQNEESGNKTSSYQQFLQTYPKAILLFFVALTAGLAVYGFGVFTELDDAGWFAPNSESARINHYLEENKNVSQTTAVISKFPLYLLIT
jgi:predicted DNA repair protein MutK